MTTAMPVVSPPPSSPLPLTLPRLVMRRAVLVALAVLLLALVLGLVRVADDIHSEVRAAESLARLVAQLGSLAGTPDEPALRALHDLQQTQPLRHLELQVRAADGRALLTPPVQPAQRGFGTAVLQALLTGHRTLFDAGPAAPAVHWQLARPDGPPWQLTLTASHESERREAMVSLLGMLALLLGCVGALLLVMHWNLRQAFAPLGRLLAAMAGIEAQNTRAVKALPTMPIRELEAVAGGLRHLAAALDEAEAGRRHLSRQLLSLQEDERARLARELHDEFGQRLTALRADAAWLGRRLVHEPAWHAVVLGMAEHCARLQDEARALLLRLRPFDTGALAQTPGAEPLAEPLARLAELLQALVASWRGGSQGEAVQLRLVLRWQLPSGAQLPWPGADSAAPALPQPMALALYRISQEALTNVARHAQARQATLQLTGRGLLQPGATVQIDWTVSDDGMGLAAPQRAAQQGSGLAGMRERVWAQGADLQLRAADAGAERPGLHLSARFNTRLQAGAATAGDAETGPPTP